MKAGIAFDPLRASPGYCPIDPVGANKVTARGVPLHPTSAFPCIGHRLQHDSRPWLPKTVAFVPEYVCFIKSWATKKPLLESSLVFLCFVLSRFYMLLRGDIIFFRSRTTKDAQNYQPVKWKCSLHLNCIVFNWWSIMAIPLPLEQMEVPISESGHRKAADAHPSQNTRPGSVPQLVPRELLLDELSISTSFTQTRSL